MNLTHSIYTQYLFLILGKLESYKIIFATLIRIVLTFLLDLFLALCLGIPAGLWKTFEEIIRPLESAVRSVPTMGVILLSLIWLDAELTPIFVTTLIVFPMLYRNVLDGIRSLDRGLLEFHRVHEVPMFKRIKCFYIPALLPFLRSGCVAGLGLAFKVMITAEVLSQPQTAIGTIYQIERSRLNTAAVMAWSFLLIIISAGVGHAAEKMGQSKTEAVKK